LLAAQAVVNKLMVNDRNKKTLHNLNYQQMLENIAQTSNSASDSFC